MPDKLEEIVEFEIEIQGCKNCGLYRDATAKLNRETGKLSYECDCGEQYEHELGKDKNNEWKLPKQIRAY